MKRSDSAIGRYPRWGTPLSVVASCAALGLGLGACGGVTTFKDTTPLTINVPPPEPPPPPPQPKPKKRVEVKVDRIEINEKIQFELNKATIMAESDDLLEEIKTVLAQNPQIAKVEIIGHTSDEGSEAYNQELSEARAKAVLDHLVAHGIDAERLTSKGLGESSPLADNATEDGREQNRRVEFLILEQVDPEAAAKKAKKKAKKKKKKGADE